jgi:hypothetical protein
VSFVNEAPGEVHTHISFYVGVTLKSSVFPSPLTGQFKIPDLGLENLGY